jgi:PII-like signaling protein
MRSLETKKLLTLIASNQLEEMILKQMTQHDIGGYTVVRAHGAGASGIQSGMLDFDANILVYIIMSEARLERVLVDIDKMMDKGYRIKALVTDIDILPRKPSGDQS